MALRFIEPSSWLTKRIPGILSGILFSLSPLMTFAAETRLAEQFYQEEDWSTCIQESQRVLCQSPSNENALLLYDLASLRAGQTNLHVHLSSLTSLARHAQSLEVRAMAANEAAWILARQRRFQEAWPLAEQAFLSTTSTPLFLSSGALLQEILTRQPKLVTPSDSIRMQMETCAQLFYNAPIPPESVVPNTTHTSLLSLPGQWIVSFYRGAIRPALGARCSMKPHCSEYFLLATRKHKLLAIPMIADRLVREPSVVSAGLHALQESGTTVYEDPVENHDFWMTSRP
jgi:putative component of membrane protein insertase Oxa1/YidC/SpoIIIJ protein YidD